MGSGGVTEPASRAGLAFKCVGLAKHNGVSVQVCPPRQGSREGVVEKSNLTAAERWWRTFCQHGS